MEIKESALDDDAARATAEHAFALWIRPELERRRAAGEHPAHMNELLAAQVIFDVDNARQVRLNDEVKGVFAGRPARPSEVGDVVTIADIASIESVELTTEDPNQAHLTLVRFGPEGDKWFLTYDFRYNAARMAETADAAREFLDAAAWAIDAGKLRVAVDTLFSATELMAKGLLLALPLKNIVQSKGHPIIASTFHGLLARHGNTDPRYATLLKDLKKFRGDARYLERPMRVGPEMAKTMLATAEEMHAALRANIPTRHHLPPEGAATDPNRAR